MIKPEDFVRIYMEHYRQGKTLEDLADTLGTTHKSAMSKTGKFRMQGVKLPRLRTERDVDPVKLNRIVTDMMPPFEPIERTVTMEMFNATCQGCTRPFYTKSGTVKYCVDCIKNPNPYAAMELVVASTDISEPSYTQQTKPQSPKKPCKWCGAKTLRNTYCSDKCRQDHERIIADRMNKLKDRIITANIVPQEDLWHINNKSAKRDSNFIDKSKPIATLQRDSMQRLSRRALRVPNRTSPEEADADRKAIEKVRAANRKIASQEWNGAFKP